MSTTINGSTFSQSEIDTSYTRMQGVSAQGSASELVSAHGMSEQGVLDAFTAVNNAESSVTAEFSPDREGCNVKDGFTAVVQTYSNTIEAMDSSSLTQTQKDQVFSLLVGGANSSLVTAHLLSTGMDASAADSLSRSVSSTFETARSNIADALAPNLSSGAQNLDNTLQNEIDNGLCAFSDQLPTLRTAVTNALPTGASTTDIDSAMNAVFANYSTFVTASTSAMDVSGVDSVEAVALATDYLTDASISQSISQPAAPRNANNPYLTPSVSATLQSILHELAQLNEEVTDLGFEFCLNQMTNMIDNADAKAMISEAQRDLEKTEEAAKLTSAVMSLVGTAIQVGMVFGPAMSKGLSKMFSKNKAKAEGGGVEGADNSQKKTDNDTSSVTVSPRRTDSTSTQPSRPNDGAAVDDAAPKTKKTEETPNSEAAGIAQDKRAAETAENTRADRRDGQDERNRDAQQADKANDARTETAQRKETANEDAVRKQDEGVAPSTSEKSTVQRETSSDGTATTTNPAFGAKAKTGTTKESAPPPPPPAADSTTSSTSTKETTTPPPPPAADSTTQQRPPLQRTKGSRNLQSETNPPPATKSISSTDQANPTQTTQKTSGATRSLDGESGSANAGKVELSPSRSQDGAPTSDSVKLGKGQAKPASTTSRSDADEAVDQGQRRNEEREHMRMKHQAAGMVNNLFSNIGKIVESSIIITVKEKLKAVDEAKANLDVSEQMTNSAFQKSSGDIEKSNNSFEKIIDQIQKLSADEKRMVEMLLQNMA